MINIKDEVKKLSQSLAKLSDPERAKNQKKYLKSLIQFYGVRVPDIRTIAKHWMSDNKDATFDQILGVTGTLWELPHQEERMLAIFLLQAKRESLHFHHLPMIENMVRTSHGWSELDGVAAWLCGAIFTDSPEEMTRVQRKWVKDANFWVRRAALLTLLGPVREDPKHFTLFSELATPLLGEKEFFIRKAIGWVLRELSKTQSDLVAEYVKEHKSQMSGLTYREATRQLPEKMQSSLKAS